MSNFKPYIDMKDGNLLPLISNATALSDAVKLLTSPFQNTKIDKVASLEATGFIFGGAVANVLGTGFLPIRKVGKFEGVTKATEKFFDSSKKEKQLEVQLNMVSSGDKILIIDDWVQSAAQLLASIKLLESLDLEIVGVGVVLDESTDEIRKILQKYNYHYVIDYRTCW